MISKQTIQAVAAKQDAMAAKQRENFDRMMQESFDEAQAVSATRLQFAHAVADKLMVGGAFLPTSNPDRFADEVFAVADALAQEHHRRATADRLAWFASKGLTPPMQVLDSAKRMGLEVPTPAAPQPIVVVD